MSLLTNIIKIIYFPSKKCKYNNLKIFNDPNFPTLEDELQNDIMHESGIFSEETPHKRRHQKHKTLDKGSSSRQPELL